MTDDCPAEAEQQVEEISARDLIIFNAELCEKAARYEDMAKVMKGLCYSYDELTVDERNLLSCAYKNVIGSRRSSWKILREALEATETKPNQKVTNQLYNSSIVNSLLSAVELELNNHCSDIIEILTSRLIPSAATNGESRVFYYKMKGDYLRYLCEICKGQEKKEKANESLLAYKTATERAKIELPPTHSVRLGLMLNFSVFYYEIMKSPERSCRLAKQAFDDAIAELDTLSEESYRDSTIIMQLLRDNLNLWQSEQSINTNTNSELIQAK